MDDIKGDLYKSIARPESGAEETAVSAPQQVQTYRQKAGIAAQEGSTKALEAKGIRFRGKIIAQKEFEKSQEDQKRLIAEISKTMKFKSIDEQAKFELGFNARMNKAKMAILAQSLNQSYDAAWKKVEQDKKWAWAKSLGSALSGGVSMMVGGIGGGKPEAKA